MTLSSDTLHYVYAVVPGAFEARGAPEGIDGRVVYLLREGTLGALVSEVDAGVYAERAEALAADVEWLGPRAAAHDRVATWASDGGAMVPLPIFTLFRDEGAVRAMLRERTGPLEALLARVGAGREYVVRLFRMDDELARHLDALSPRIAELERQAAAATPGQRYLLQRKLDGERREEARHVGREAARDAYDLLAALSLDATAEELPRPVEDARGSAVLNAAFLVAHERYREFQAAVTAIVRRHEGRGFRVEFTGPWPPHHFAREAPDA